MKVTPERMNLKITAKAIPDTDINSLQEKFILFANKIIFRRKLLKRESNWEIKVDFDG